MAPFLKSGPFPGDGSSEGEQGVSITWSHLNVPKELLDRRGCRTCDPLCITTIGYSEPQEPSG